MTLKDALEMGIDCGLTTVGEAILNIEFHSPSLFSYTEIENELSELRAEFLGSGYTPHTLITETEEIKKK